MKALSLKQPWAYLVVAGLKDIENRNWITPHRGPLLIHASKTYDIDAYRWFRSKGMTVSLPSVLPIGGVVGMVDLVDIVTSSTSIWYDGGTFGWVFANPQRTRLVEMRGNPGIFEVDWEAYPHGQ